ncbi:MAG TPA: hypothetical protein VFN24_01960 [Microbacterium sp.]|nr:hypothetical protein [Microbacterium sp.]
MAALGGIATLLVTLLPLPGMDGKAILTASKPVWFGLYFTTLTLFLLLVLPDARYWSQLGDQLWRWIAVFAVFAVLSVATYLAMNVWAARQSSATDAAAPASDPDQVVALEPEDARVGGVSVRPWARRSAAWRSAAL